MFSTLFTEAAVREALGRVIDPELGVNVVDLGLVRHISIQDGQVDVRMTMTSPGCPLQAVLVGAARQAIRRSVPGLEEVRIDIEWEPPWRVEDISVEGRSQLGW